MLFYEKKRSIVWFQQRGPSDCLTKTQGHANSKEEVYGLTPAQCWKVKRKGASSESKPQ